MKSLPISWSGKPPNITLRPEESRPNGPVLFVTAGRTRGRRASSRPINGFFREQPVIIASVVLHTLSAAAAFVGVGVLHVLSDRGIWALFPDAYQVRQLSIYVIDTIPFFVLSVVAVCAVFRRVAGGDGMPFGAFLVAGLVSVAGAVLLHLPFYPTSVRALVFLSVFALLYVSAYAVGGRVLFGWEALGDRFRPFPRVAGLVPGLLTGVSVCVLYVGFFQAAKVAWGLAEDETYRIEREPSPRDTWFVPAESPPAPAAGGKFRAPDTGLFRMEELPVSMPGKVHVVDLDGDGFYDVVGRGSAYGLDLWRNDNGTLKRKEGFLANLKGQRTGNFSFADYDLDGKVDVIVGRLRLPVDSPFENAYLKKIFWYPTDSPAADGRLYKQLDPDRWEDVTERAFPGGAPWAYRKVEPILWLDANGDGRLDFVWSQYPHPRRSLNALFVQRPDGTFVDRISDLLRWAPGRIYPEGSDLADLDGDGDIDLFAYGYLFRNEDGRYHQVCGAALSGLPCDMEGRTDEGGLFEDVDGDGTLDLVLSHHGSSPGIPKYRLQLFLGNPREPGRLTRVAELGNLFYGFNTYLRAQDYDFNGRPDILTIEPGRLLSYHQGRWVDLLPAITGSPSGAFRPLGWLDIDEDGDWDFLAVRKGDGKTVLFRNRSDPARYVKISAVGEGGVENQYGATIRLTFPGGRSAVRSYRPMGGYAGFSDPRLVYRLEPDREYRIRTCFASMAGRPETPSTPAGVRLNILGVTGNCVDYGFAVAGPVTRVDLKLVAGREGALVDVRRD